MELNIKPSKEACGAEVTGIDLTKELSDTEVESIREAWLLHHVLSFPDQSLSDDDLERFTLYFGYFSSEKRLAVLLTCQVNFQPYRTGYIGGRGVCFRLKYLST